MLTMKCINMLTACFDSFLANTTLKIGVQAGERVCNHKLPDELRDKDIFI